MFERMNISYSIVNLKLGSPFAIAHGVFPERFTVLVRISGKSGDGKTAEGFGEIPIVPYYNITPESAVNELRGLWTVFNSSDNAVEISDSSNALELSHRVENLAEVHPFVRAGLSAALLDFASAAQGVSLHDLLGVSKVCSVNSSFTIAERNVENACSLARELSGITLKIKAGFPGDTLLAAAIRKAAPENVCFIDCNGGWQPENAVSEAVEMASKGVSLIEEPVYRNWRKLGELAELVKIPVLADESLCTVKDVEMLVKYTPENTGAVIKVSKHGGPWNTLKIIRALKEAGRPYMLGQMVESSVGTACAMCFAGEASWVDLDGPVLILNDPGAGLDVRRGLVSFNSPAGRASVSPTIKFKKLIVDK